MIGLSLNNGILFYDVKFFTNQIFYSRDEPGYSATCFE